MCKFPVRKLNLWELHHWKEKVRVQLFQSIHRLGTAHQCDVLILVGGQSPARYPSFKFHFFRKKVHHVNNKACVLHKLIFLFKKSDGLIFAPRHSKKIKCVYICKLPNYQSNFFLKRTQKDWLNFKSGIASFLRFSTFDHFHSIMWKTNLHSLEPLNDK